MNSFFSMAKKRLALLDEAHSWMGTPFMPNAAIKGAGVSCQKLVGAIYIAAGVWPADFNVPDGAMDWGNAHKDSLITGSMDEEVKSGRFVEVLDSTAVPGDLVGFKIGGCLHHLGIVLTTSGSFIHCLRGPGVMISELRDATYLKRIEKIWRPLDREATE
jgi:cell wall-associated NlpC family hydrolase